MTTRILFVCLGNICRSPTAEGVMRQLAPGLEIDSAGTSNWEVGSPPYGPMREVAAARGYDLSGLRARQVTRADFERFDMIYAMDGDNLADLEALRPAGATATLSRLLDHLPNAPVRDVPDPYYTRDFTGAFDLIEAACQELAKELGG